MTDTAPPASRRGRLFVLSGPSGVGKSTVLAAVRPLLPEVWYSVSATTRPPRPGEVDGVNYHFVDRAAFDALVAGDAMLEWAEFAGNCYGTPRTAVEDRLAGGSDVLLEIEVNGARQVRAALGDQAVLIFLAPPSYEELARRLAGRGTEDAATRQARLRAALAELASEPEFDHTVVNTSVEDAVAALVDLMAGPRAVAAGGPA